ncbi:2-succinylbenzoate--CoA ligase [Streptomyces fumanus]
MHIADDGEIWLRGHNVFQGYLNNPKATDETLHDGWLATGDLGALDADGYLTITGRKKEILESFLRRQRVFRPACWRSGSGTIRWSASASWSATTGRTSPP